ADENRNLGNRIQKKDVLRPAYDIQKYAKCQRHCAENRATRMTARNQLLPTPITKPQHQRQHYWAMALPHNIPYGLVEGDIRWHIHEKYANREQDKLHASRSCLQGWAHHWIRNGVRGQVGKSHGLQSDIMPDKFLSEPTY